MAPGQTRRTAFRYAGPGGTRGARQRLRLVTRILESAYGTPDLGNKVDPLDELLYLLISQRTRITTAQSVYGDLGAQFSPWQKALDGRRRRRLGRILAKGGRGSLRTRAVLEVLHAVKDRTGDLSLEFLRGLPPADAQEFLLSLPWVGQKTAYCVMMYSLGHGVFPVDSNVERVVRRTGLLADLGVSLEGVDHRTAQRRIAPLVPADVAYPLHVNMVVHGREACVARAPRCHLCPIRAMCNSRRTTEAARSQPIRLTMVDLFCGAGGISHGFARAGIRPVLAVDADDAACETYRLNTPWVAEDRVVQRDLAALDEGDIRGLIGDERVDVLVAGVPCQGFSSVGLTTKPSLRRSRPPEKEPVNRLFMEVLRWTAVLLPRVVLLENVPAMGRSRVFYKDATVGVRDLLEETLAGLGYSTATLNLNSADFGIPQVRRRLFFLALRGGPPGDGTSSVVAQSMDKWLPTMSHRELPAEAALHGLPRLHPLEGDEISPTTSEYPNGHPRASAYERFVYDNPRIVFNHVARHQNADDMVIVSALRPGESYRQVVMRRPDVIANRKMKVYSLDGFDDKFFRLDPSRPGRTIVAHLAKDGNSFIHPFEDRAITVREAARLQSFPDSFIFCGPRSAQFSQVGNAVPPLLAWALGAFVASLLEEGPGAHG